MDIAPTLDVPVFFVIKIMGLFQSWIEIFYLLHSFVSFKFHREIFCMQSAVLGFWYIKRSATGPLFMETENVVKIQGQYIIKPKIMDQWDLQNCYVSTMVLRI